MVQQWKSVTVSRNSKVWWDSETVAQSHSDSKMWWNSGAVTVKCGGTDWNSGIVVLKCGGTVDGTLIM